MDLAVTKYYIIFETKKKQSMAEALELSAKIFPQLCRVGGGVVQEHLLRSVFVFLLDQVQTMLVECKMIYGVEFETGMKIPEFG